MAQFKAVPEEQGKTIHVFDADSYVDARRWIVNNLKLSNNYSLTRIDNPSQHPLNS